MLSGMEEESIIIPKDYEEAKQLVNKLGIDDLRFFCSTFGVSQDGNKQQLLQYDGTKLSPKQGPIATPRKGRSASSPSAAQSEEKGNTKLDDIEKRLEKSVQSIEQEFWNSEERITQ